MRARYYRSGSSQDLNWAAMSAALSCGWPSVLPSAGIEGDNIALPRKSIRSRIAGSVKKIRDSLRSPCGGIASESRSPSPFRHQEVHTPNKSSSNECQNALEFHDNDTTSITPVRIMTMNRTEPPRNNPADKSGIGSNWSPREPLNRWLTDLVDKKRSTLSSSMEPYNKPNECSRTSSTTRTSGFSASAVNGSSTKIFQRASRPKDHEASTWTACTNSRSSSWNTGDSETPGDPATSRATSRMSTRSTIGSQEVRIPSKRRKDTYDFEDFEQSRNQQVVSPRNLCHTLHSDVEVKVDDNLSVPVDLYRSLLEGAEKQKVGQHRLHEKRGAPPRLIHRDIDANSNPPNTLTASARRQAMKTSQRHRGIKTNG